MKRLFKHIETKLIHAGEPEPRIYGSVSIPIFQSSTFEYSNEESYDNIKYVRLSNTPNHIALHEKLAALETAESALVTSSGMSAISTTLSTICSAGDHFLALNCLYGGTYDLITKDLTAQGISVDFVDGNGPESWREKLRSNTKAVFFETLTNPLIDVPDLRSLVDFAKKHELVSIIDNTFASPINFRPAEWGFDLSVHSCTKYLNGHSDIAAGAVIG